jgi:hypothetical protein
MLDHARKLTDPEEGDGTAPDGESRALAIIPERIDLEDARDLIPFIRNAEKLAPPTFTQRLRRRMAKRWAARAERYEAWRLDASRWFDRLDIAPDLAEDIGSRRWLRGLGTMVGLGAVALAFWPDLTPLEARPAMPRGEAVDAELRSQMILPLALGADSGRRMGPTQAVIPLKSAPERPQIQMVVTLAPGDSFASMLRRRRGGRGYRPRRRTGGPGGGGGRYSAGHADGPDPWAPDRPGPTAPARQPRLPRAVRS